MVLKATVNAFLIVAFSGTRTKTCDEFESEIIAATQAILVP